MPKQKKKTAASKSSKSKQSTRAAGNAKKETPRIDHSAIMKNRMTGAIVCFFLAIFAALGYFSGDGLFISFFRKFLSGLLGWAFYAVTPALVIAGLLLALEKSRPVKLRVVFVLLVPAILSALFHALICKEKYAAKFSIFGQLYKSGKAGESGGIIGGIVGGGFRALFGKAGAAIVFICLLIVALFIIINRTPSEIIAALRKKKVAKEEKRAAYYDAYMQYEQEQEEKRAAAEAASAAVTAKFAGTKRPVIDIPVDDPPPAGEKPKKQAARKEGFFNKTPRVKTPDQLFADAEAAAKDSSVPTQQTAGEEVPFQLHTSVPKSSPQPAGPAQEPVSIRPGSVNIMRRESRQAAPPEPLPPEPAVQPLTIPEPPASAGPAQTAQTAKPEGAQKKVTAEEAAAEQAKIAESIEKTMESVPQQPQYIFPPVTLLDAGDAGGGRDGREEARLNAGRLESTLSSFGINAQINNIVQGPAVTRYEFELEQGVKLNRLTNLSDDIALSLGASGVRIAPIPGKIAIVGIEVPNKLVSTVHLREIIESSEFRNSKSKVSFALGKDIGGSYIVGDISKLPHMLIAGTTGSGKSVCINSLIISLLYKAKPEEVRLILVDPKMVELGVYNGIPHLLIPVVTDPKKAAGALQWAVNEMMKRYQRFADAGVRDIQGYNAKVAGDPEVSPMPQIVIVIDELADLMFVAAKEVEEAICRIAQLARAAGMHLVIATQRPSADVITGIMKANIPSRISFAVASALESRIILDSPGAEKLVGHGDMLYAPLGAGKPLRVQGTFIDSEEVEAVVNFVKQSSAANYDDSIISDIENRSSEKKPAEEEKPAAADDVDELFDAAVEVILEVGQASVSMLQRRLKLGYSRAARLVDQMEERGIVGQFEGSKPRQILITKDQWNEMKFINGTASIGEAPPPEDYEKE